MSYLNGKIKFSHPKWSVFSRVLAAIFAGYALATTSVLFLAQLLFTSIGQYEAVQTGMLLSFIIYAGAAMWVFSVNSARKAWFGLLKLNVILLLLTWALLQVNKS